MFCVKSAFLLLSAMFLLSLFVQSGEAIGADWTQFSVSSGNLPAPNSGVEQTASLVLDIDADGIDDFVIAERTKSPSVVWYKKNGNGNGNGNNWEKRTIEPASLTPEAGGAFADIDNDGDLDIAFGGDYRSAISWWWENPGTKNGAVYSATSWTRHTIYDASLKTQHDQAFGDFDNDGILEYAWWGRDGSTSNLYLAEVPDNPRTSVSWPVNIIASKTDGVSWEGMAAADIDLDGIVDIVGGGGWFKYNGGTVYTRNSIETAPSGVTGRVAVGQLKKGGRPEVVFGAGDFTGSIAWYEWNGGGWTRHELDSNSVQGHSIALGDLDTDGDLDIFVAEMTNWGTNTNPNSKMRIYKNDGAANPTFTATDLQAGINNHESKLGDFNGDGLLDILSKSYADSNPPAPQLIVWLQTSSGTMGVSRWTYKEIDRSRSIYGDGWKKFFGLAFVDGDNDGDMDIVSGRYYYENPGGDMLNGGLHWTRTTFDTNVDASLVTNVDGDEKADVIAFGLGSPTTDPGVYWLEKGEAGAGPSGWKETKVLSNTIIPPTSHSQPQGFRMAQIVPGGREEIVTTGDNPGKLFYIQIPANPAITPWPGSSVTVISNSHNNQGVAVGDINKDGYLDVAGVMADNSEVVWWENPCVAGQGNWVVHHVGLATPINSETSADGPDRVEMADLNGDGLLDIILTDEVWDGTNPLRAKSRTYWFAQPANAGTAADWGASKQITEQQSTNSLDVADIDFDGDADVVTGEHKGDKELTIWQNDGTGTFTKNVISTGYENHNGGQLVDLDGDGDLDIVSITWDDNFATTGGLMHMWRNDNVFATATQQIYKEYSRVMDGSKDWRVTDPDAPFVGPPGNTPGAFLPNSELPIIIDDLQGAGSAEAIMSVWGGHPGSTGKKFRFNSNQWITIPELSNTPTSGECYTSQRNAILSVPLADLVEGNNILEGTAGPQSCYDFGWGQWGWYSIIMRIYYDASKPHVEGIISSHRSGDTLAENPTLKVAITRNDNSVGISRVEYFAYYDGFDTDGDGVFQDYQVSYHREQSSSAVGPSHHVGTATSAPYEVTWNTEWVPDQVPGSIRIMARILDANGVWFATPEVTGLSLARPGVSVQLYKPQGVPEHFWVRAGETMSSKFTIPASALRNNATDAKLFVRTWNGENNGDTYSHTKVNGNPVPKYGEAHFYSYDSISIDPDYLVTGENTVTFHSETEHHGIEILWPGPAVMVKYNLSVPNPCIHCAYCERFKKWYSMCAYITSVCISRGLPAQFCDGQKISCEGLVDKLIKKCNSVFCPGMNVCEK